MNYNSTICLSVKLQQLLSQVSAIPSFWCKNRQHLIKNFLYPLVFHELSLKFSTELVSLNNHHLFAYILSVLILFPILIFRAIGCSLTLLE